MRKFETSKFGYNKDDVNAFISEVTAKYEEMLSSLKERDIEIQNMEEKLVYYKNLESSLNRALLVAEDASGQIKRIAREEANLLLEDAKKNASRIINNALLKAEKVDNEAENLKRKVSIYKRKVRQVMEEQELLLDEIEEKDM